MIDYIGDKLALAAGPAQEATTIATVFPKTGTIVTTPGVHATQRMDYVERERQRRAAQNKPLTDEEADALMDEAVDLVIQRGKIFIRPDPDRMDLAFAADDLLQQAAPKQAIRFLYVKNAQVSDPIRQRGQAWRVHPPPKTTDEMKETIGGALTAVGGRRIYYYNPVHGTRILTCDQFARLGELNDDELRFHLIELAELSGRSNALGYPELDFFPAEGDFKKDELGKVDWKSLDGAGMRGRHAEMVKRLQASVLTDFQTDSLERESWRNRMYAALVGRGEDEVSEAELLGLGAEFFLQVQWLPGARTEGGELIFDTVSNDPNEPEFDGPRTMVVRGLICNLMQEYGDIEFVNIGQIISTMSKRVPGKGRREVYLCHFKQRHVPRETLRVIRMQKFGVAEHLDEGFDLLRAMIDTEDYTDYIMDRRLACRQLGMNLTLRTSVRKVVEWYHGRQKGLDGVRIWSPYFEREYVSGIASDKIPPAKLKDPAYAAALATLLGLAAAPNLIVGRYDPDTRVVFDDSDEMVVEDAHGMPASIVVADHTSTFGNYKDDLAVMAPRYAETVNRRAKMIPSVPLFTQCYVEAFLRRFKQIQEDYRLRRRAYEGLFKHRPVDPGGNLAFRWLLVLARLDRSNADELAELIRQNVKAE